MSTPAIFGIDHLNLVVADLDRSLAFYTELLGFRQTQRTVLEGEWIGQIVGLPNARAEVAFIEPPAKTAGTPRIELLQYLSPEGEALELNSVANTRGLRHLALRVEDIAAMKAHLESHGVSFFGEPVVVPEGIIQRAGGVKKTLVYFLDPDGVILELAQYE